MPKYRVHAYREFRVTFEEIEAESAIEAAKIAKDTPTNKADSWEDAEAETETISASVDLIGDKYHEHSKQFEFCKVESIEEKHW